MFICLLFTVIKSQLHAQASSTPNTAVGGSTQDLDLSGSGCGFDDVSNHSGSGYRHNYMETDIDAVIGSGVDAEEFEQRGPKADGLKPSSSGSGQSGEVSQVKCYGCGGLRAKQRR